MADANDPNPELLIIKRFDQLDRRDAEHGKSLNKHNERLTTIQESLAAVVRTMKTLTTEPLPDVQAGETPGDRPPGARPGRRSWLLVTDAAYALNVMEELADWLERVYLRFDHVTLPSCWLWHPGVVEELWALRRLHAYAHACREENPQKEMDWLNTYRPKVVERIKKAVGTCELSFHTESGREGKRPPTRLPLKSAIPRMTEFNTRPDSATAPRPLPTPEELHEAEQHQKSNYP